MKKSTWGIIMLCAVMVWAAGCGQAKTGSSDEAIQNAKAMEAPTEEKVKYLVNQAKAMYNSDEFQDTVNVAQYVLRYLDKDSQQAKDLLEMAKKDLMAAGEGAMADMKKKFSF